MKGTPSLVLSGKNTSQAVLADWARRASAFEEKLDEQRLQLQALGSGRTVFANVHILYTVVKDGATPKRCPSKQP